jgi:hypothetical protein
MKIDFRICGLDSLGSGWTASGQVFDRGFGLGKEADIESVNNYLLLKIDSVKWSWLIS